MKRLIAIIMVIIISIGLIGCGQNSDIRVPLNFYYCSDPVTYNSQTGVIAPEVREGSNITGLHDALNVYLDGPVSDGYRSIFPKNTSIVDISQSEDILTVVLSDEIASLSDHKLTLACIGLSLTALELCDCSFVRIYAENSDLSSSPFIEINRRNLLFIDSYSN